MKVSVEHLRRLLDRVRVDLPILGATPGPINMLSLYNDSEPFTSPERPLPESRVCRARYLRIDSGMFSRSSWLSTLFFAMVLILARLGAGSAEPY